MTQQGPRHMRHTSRREMRERAESMSFRTYASLMTAGVIFGLMLLVALKALMS